jgi:hypothetical protein
MPDAEFCCNAGVGNVTKVGPIGLLSRNSEDLADRSPVALAVHHVCVSQRSIYIEYYAFWALMLRG